MKQSSLNRCVANITGESVRCIQRMGFQLLIVPVSILNTNESQVEALPSAPTDKIPAKFIQHLTRPAEG